MWWVITIRHDTMEDDTIRYEKFGAEHFDKEVGRTNCFDIILRDEN